MKAFSISSRVVFIGLTAGALTGCGPDALNSSPDGQVIPLPSPTAVVASPTQGNGTSGNQQPSSCDTATYDSEVVWEGGQPQITLTQKPVAANGYKETKNLNKAPAAHIVNSDRSITFASSIEGGTLYTRVFPNGSCFIQSVASSGRVVFEENGRIRGS